MEYESDTVTVPETPMPPSDCLQALQSTINPLDPSVDDDFAISLYCLALRILNDYA